MPVAVRRGHRTSSKPTPGAEVIRRMKRKNGAHNGAHKQPKKGKSQADVTREHQQAFLQAYLQEGTVFHAAKQAGIARRSHYDWYEDDPAYKEAFDDVYNSYTEILEREADRRGKDGVDEPVFYLGEECGKVRKYDSSLLMFRLKKRDPSYRERYDVKHSGEVTYKEEKLETNVDFDK